MPSSPLFKDLVQDECKSVKKRTLTRPVRRRLETGRRIPLLSVLLGVKARSVALPEHPIDAMYHQNLQSQDKDLMDGMQLGLHGPDALLIERGGLS